ncbi:biogenesis of lysosome-related organelles complex 1 subunit 2-like [Glandiceps talaboti]
MAEVTNDKVPPPNTTDNSENKPSDKKDEGNESRQKAEDKKVTPVNTERQTSETGKPSVDDMCQDMFMKLEEYLKGDLAATCEDYKLLEKMNRLTIHKYSEMRQMTSSIATSMQTLNDRYKSLQPYLDQIDQVEESVANLEQAAYRLDAYSKRLETKFKQLEKR